jgi:HK97 family phage portal protein
VSLTSSLLRGAGIETRDAILAEPPDWLWNGFGIARSYSGKTVSEQLSLSLIPVFACVRLLARTAASCPIQVYNTGAERKKAEASNEWRVLHDDWNDDHTADQGIETLMAHQTLWGNYYAEKEKSSTGQVRGLWPLHPGKVNVIRDKRTQQKRFEVIGNDNRTFDDSTILHIPGLGYDGLKGLSPIAEARQELGTMLATQEYMGRFIANNATPAGVIQLPVGQDLNDDNRREALRQQWQAMYGNLSNAGRTAVLEDGATWQSIGMPLKDMEFVESSRFSVNQTARLFGVPAEMIGGDRDSSMTYSTVEMMTLHFITYSLMPWFVRIEKGLYRDRDLFPIRSRYPKFVAQALLRGDAVTRANFYKLMAEVEAITINEIRDHEDMAPRPDGDRAPIVAGKVAPGGLAPTGETTPKNPQVVAPDAQVPAPTNGKKQPVPNG